MQVVSAGVGQLVAIPIKSALVSARTLAWLPISFRSNSCSWQVTVAPGIPIHSDRRSRSWPRIPRWRFDCQVIRGGSANCEQLPRLGSAVRIRVEPGGLVRGEAGRRGTCWRGVAGSMTGSSSMWIVGTILGTGLAVGLGVVRVASAVWRRRRRDRGRAERVRSTCFTFVENGWKPTSCRWLPPVASRGV